MQNILLVEDDEHIVNINKQLLEFSGYHVFCANSAKECMEILTDFTVNLIVLDINLPDKNGLELCKDIKKNYEVPILFLSALEDSQTVVKGLTEGDDYMTKPYELEVLLARIAARIKKPVVTSITKGDLTLDSISSNASLNGKNFSVTKKEFAILWVLINNFGEIVAGEQLFDVLWSDKAEDEKGALWTIVSRLRNKLRSVGCSLEIVSERSKGYKIDYATEETE